VANNKLREAGLKAIIGLSAALMWTGAATAQTIPTPVLPATISYPEGIAFDAKRQHIYTASALDGAVVRTDLRSGVSTTIVQPGLLAPGNTRFPGLLGMKLDASNRLWISGGRIGSIFVVDASTGKLLKSFSTGKDPSLLNDVVVTRDAAYFTDTLHPMLWRVPLDNGQIGPLEPWLDLAGSPIAYGEGPNLNGITVTPDGKSLLVGQMNKGLLYRIDTASRAVTPVVVTGGEVTGIDGLVLDGRTLYLVRQPHAEIVTLNLSPDLGAAEVVNRFKDPVLLWPATAAKAGDTLLVVNAQFNRRATNDPQTPFSVAAVPLARLKGR
jgi:Cu-Zn family superoxide dismutase